MVGALAVLGDMHQHKVFSTAVVDYQTGEIKQIGAWLPRAVAACTFD